MTLRVRIALVVVVVVAAVVGIVGQRVYAAAESELVEEVDLELLGRARAFDNLSRGLDFEETFNREGLRGVAPPVEDDRTGFDRVGPRSVLDQSTARANFSRVLDDTGAVLVTLSEAFDAELEPEDFPDGLSEPTLSDGSINGERARVVTVATNDVFVQIARPLGEIEQSLADLSGRIVLISLFAIAVAGGGAWFVAGTAVRPIVRLTDAAETVAETGDLDQPVDGSGGDEVGRLASSFNAMLAALSTSRRQQRQLVMDASHELRTPLASLRTNVDVLRSGREIPAEMRDAIVADIGAEIDELGDLVAELVDLATDVREDEEPVHITLTELAAPIVERHARRTGRDIDLVTVEREEIYVRPTSVARAIRNLVENATKFSPDGSPVRVEIDAGRLIVSDEGPGIPLGDREAVFERFHRVEATRTMPGSGLGLAIVKQIAAAHGGSVFAGESTGGGAAVGFSLPDMKPPE